MNAAQVLRLLADGSSRLSDALRQALLLPSVPPGSDLARWIEDELRGYDSDPPDYRVLGLAVKGTAFNGAWLHQDNLLPLNGLPERLKQHARTPQPIVQSIGEIEGLVDGGTGSGRFAIPWHTAAVTLFNRSISLGETGVNHTYQLTEIWWEVSRGALIGILERVRQRALSGVAVSVPADERIAEAVYDLPTTPVGPLTIHGSSNQVVIGSPGSTSVYSVPQSDWIALEHALRSLGLGDADLAVLGGIVAEDAGDESGRVMRVLEWARSTAGTLGLGATGSIIGTLVLQHLGHL